MLLDDVREFLHEKRKRRPSTIYQYSYVLEQVWLPWCAAEGISEAAACTDVAMGRFADHLRVRPNRKGEPMHAETVRTYIRPVRLFLNWSNVPRGRYQLEPVPERLLETLTREEIARVEAAGTCERDRLIVRLLADTGIRASELCGLRVVDVRENRHDHTAAIRVIGKRDREREVPVPPRVFSRLKHQAAHGGNGEFVFVAKHRNADGLLLPLTRFGLYQLLRNMLLEAGITKRAYPHLLRHSYATWKLSRGMNPITLMKILGHRNLTMISTVYSHLVLTDTYAAMLATED